MGIQRTRSTESTSDFALDLNIPPQTLCRWFRRSQLCATRDWQLHHDNVPAHASCLVQSFFVKHQITQVILPLFISDLVPYNFCLFSKLKSPLKGKRFQTIDEIQENTTGQLIVLPTKDSAECFKQWKRCQENCVRYQGAYFEGDWGIITMLLVSCIYFNKCLYFS